MTNARYELAMNKAGRVTFETTDSTILRALHERRKIDVRIGGLIIQGYVTKIDSGLAGYSVEMEQSGSPRLYSNLGYPSVTGRFSSYVTEDEAKGYMSAREYLGMAPRLLIHDDPLPEHVNCRCTTLPILKETKMKKFAIGSTSFETLAEAVAYAKERVVTLGNDITITKIIRIVRRKPQPVVVEIVK